MKTIFYLIIFLLLTPLISAKYITIQNTVENTVVQNYENQSFLINITTSNLGDEPAYEVSHEALFLNKNYKSGVTYAMYPKSPENYNISIHNQNLSPGSYPIVIRTYYKDANYYPFSTLTLINSDVNTPSTSNMLLKGDSTLKLGDNKKYSLTITNMEKTEQEILVKAYNPIEIDVKQSFVLNLKPGATQTVDFDLKNSGGLVGNSYSIIFVASYNDGIYHYSYHTMRVNIVKPSITSINLTSILVLAITLIGSILLLIKYRKNKKNLVNTIGLIIIFIFLLYFFNPSVLFSKTITTGGDTASHYYTAKLFSSFLPHLSGWTFGNYAGFPMLQYYFPLPFLFMSLAAPFLSLQVAFKIGSILGVLLLPLFTFFACRKLDLKFPLPLIASFFSLIFLFNEGNSMWGGNIPSTLAGEFSYSLGFALLILFLGYLYREENPKKLALLIFLIGLSHIYTLFIALAVSLFFLITKSWKTFLKRVKHFVYIYGIGILMLGIWFVPLYGKLEYTTSYADFWIVRLSEIFPKIFIPILILNLITISLIIISIFKQNFFRYLKQTIYIYFICLVSLFFYYIAVYIGVVNIRFIPFIQFLLTITATIPFLYLFSGKIKWHTFLSLILIIGISITWVATNVSYIDNWISWNYEGFEKKAPYNEFKEINDYLKGDFNDPRVVFEHSDTYNRFGTIRAFESLPLFAGRANLEGLYMQSSLNAPFIFYMQSLYSKQKSCPFPNFGCTKTNLTKAYPYLKLYNVNQEIVASDIVKNQMDNNPKYTQEFSTGIYSVYNIAIENKYVYVPENKINVINKDYNQKQAFLWFIDENNLDTPIVFSKDLKANEFLIQSDSLIKEKLGIQCMINTTIKDNKIKFSTTCPGVPHIIKVSYFPNWKSKTGEKIYHASPSFMMIIPNDRNVELYYGWTIWEYIGLIFSIIGFLLITIKSKLILKYLTIVEKFFHNKKILFFLIIVIGAITFFSLMSGDNDNYLIKDIAIATKNYQPCEFAGDYHDQCFTEVAKRTYDYNLCTVRVTKKNKDKCYYEVAKEFNDQNLCNRIINQEIKNKCIAEKG